MGSKKMGECSSTIKFNPKISLQDDERKGQSEKWMVNETLYQVLGELIFVNQNNNWSSSNTSKIPCDYES